MPETYSTRAATLSGGISTQRSEARSNDQVADALNADFDLRYGLAIRSGTRTALALGTSVAPPVWNDRHVFGEIKADVVIDSAGVVRAFIDGIEATVFHHPAAKAYLAGSGLTRPRAEGHEGDTPVVRIANPIVPPALLPSPVSPPLKLEHPTYTALESHTPEVGSVHRAVEGVAPNPPGLYRYIPGDSVPSVLKGSEVNSGGAAWTTFINAPGQNPQGATFRFAELKFNALAASYNHGTRTLTATGQFANWNFAPGRLLFVSGPVGVTAGCYEITAKLDDDRVVLATSPGNSATLDVRGVGIEVKVVKDFAANPVGSPVDFAKEVQKALRDGGATNACVWFKPTDTSGLSKGFLYVSNTFSGVRAGFPDGGMAVVAPDGTTFSWLTGSWPFNATTLASGGKGWPTGRPPKDRWKMVPAPNQTDSTPDPAGMPVSLRRLVRVSLESAILSLRPVAYWKMTDPYGANAMDSSSRDFEPVGTLHGDANGTPSAIGVFDGVDDYILFPSGAALNPILERARTDGLTVFFKAGFTSGNGGLVLALDGGNVQIRPNYDAGAGAVSNGKVSVRYGSHWYVTGVIANLNTGAKVVTVTASGSGVTVYVNGVAAAAGVTGGGQVSLPQFQAFSAQVGGGPGYAYFQGSISHMAIFRHSISASEAAWLALAPNLDVVGPGVTLPGEAFMLDLGVYAPRLTGTSQTNPAPAFLRNRVPIRDITMWETRLTVGAGDRFSASAIDDERSFFDRESAVPTDGEPIDRIVVPEGSSIVSLTRYGSILYATTDGPTQYELSFSNGLSASTLSSRAGLSRPVVGRPTRSGDRLYVASPSSSGGSAATILEVNLDEQSVSTSSDDVGQHFHGRINAAVFDLSAIPSAGLVLMCKADTPMIYVHQSAWVGTDRRQSAWSVFDVGGTIKSASCDGLELSMLVLRSGTYILERWSPEHPSGWPASAIRLDGRVSVTGGAYAGGVTTFTMPANIPATGITHAVTSIGQVCVATPISATQFTTAENLAGVAVTAGRTIPTTATLSTPHSRDLNGQAYLSTDLHQAYTVLTTTDPARVKASVRVDARQPELYPVVPINGDPSRCRVWTRGPAGRTTITFILSGPAPLSIGTAEQVSDAVPHRS